MTPSASTMSSVDSAVNGIVGMITVFVPSSSGAARFPTPAMWNSGTLMSTTSSVSKTFDVRMIVIACMSRLRWVSIAPLGRPVVPDVYMITATSFSSISTCGSVSEAEATALS